MKYKDNFINLNERRRPIGECGKVQFDKKTAQTKKNYLLKIGTERYLRIYNCPICNAWHLTKRPG